MYVSRSLKCSLSNPDISIRLVTALIFVLLTVCSGFAAEYHVDCINGSDDFPGSKDKPFKSISRASRVLKPGDKAIIHPGEYHEQIMGGVSGARDASITYEGMDRDKVILRGSVLLNN